MAITGLYHDGKLYNDKDEYVNATIEEMINQEKEMYKEGVLYQKYEEWVEEQTDKTDVESCEEWCEKNKDKVTTAELDEFIKLNYNGVYNSWAEFEQEYKKFLLEIMGVDIVTGLMPMTFDYTEDSTTNKKVFTAKQSVNDIGYCSDSSGIYVSLNVIGLDDEEVIVRFNITSIDTSSNTIVYKLDSDDAENAEKLGITIDTITVTYTLDDEKKKCTYKFMHPVTNEETTIDLTYEPSVFYEI